jgi:hypothetical protein
MQVLRKDSGQFRVLLRSWEEAVLRESLLLHPLIPAEHHRITRQAEAPDLDSAQKLLDEAMATQRAEHRHRLDRWLAAEGRFVPREKGEVELRLAEPDTEWFLQVLNDIRVGSWLRLGCPEEWDHGLSEEQWELLPYYLAAELCGWLQALLLKAMTNSE